MPKALTAEEILPLVACLSPEERARLMQLLKVRPSAADAYATRPPSDNEFGGDEDPLEWDSDGWEDVG